MMDWVGKNGSGEDGSKKMGLSRGRGVPQSAQQNPRDPRWIGTSALSFHLQAAQQNRQLVPVSNALLLSFQL